MHEVSLAEQLLPAVLSAAAGQAATRITSVTVSAGALQQIVPECLASAFAAAAAGSLAEGAELFVETTPVTARCRRCGRAFTVIDFDFCCPACGLADVETTGGAELLLTSLEIEA